MSIVTRSQIQGAQRVLHAILGTSVGDDVVVTLYSSTTGKPDEEVLTAYYAKLEKAGVFDKNTATKTLGALISTLTNCLDPAVAAAKEFVLATAAALSVSIPNVPCKTSPGNHNRANKKPSTSSKSQSFPSWGGLLIGMIVAIVLLAVVVGVARAHHQVPTSEQSDAP